MSSNIWRLWLSKCEQISSNKKIGSHLDTYNRQLLLDMINRFDIQFFLTGTDKNLFSFVSTNAQFYNITGLWILNILPIQLKY